MSEPKSSAQIRAEIFALQQQLAELGESPDDVPLEVGEIYFLSIGTAKVVQFYEEEGLQKIQMRLTPVDPEDGLTPYEDRHESLCSMPIPRFRHLMARFEKEQKNREQIERRKSERQARKEAALKKAKGEPPE